jgi:hypothetical protein
VLADAPNAVMQADAGAPAPQFLHLLLRQLGWQMPAPPQSMHSLLRRLCWQMLAPWCKIQTGGTGNFPSYTIHS